MDRVSLALLVLAVSLSLSWAVLHGGSARSEGDARSFVKRRKSAPFHPSSGLREKLSESKPFLYPSEHIHDRQRRSDETCGLKKTTVLETDPVSPYSSAYSPRNNVMFTALSDGDGGGHTGSVG